MGPRIREDTEGDYYLTPEQALDYGIIDEILGKAEDKEEDAGADS